MRDQQIFAQKYTYAKKVCFGRKFPIVFRPKRKNNTTKQFIDPGSQIRLKIISFYNKHMHVYEKKNKKIKVFNNNTRNDTLAITRDFCLT